VLKQVLSSQKKGVPGNLSRRGQGLLQVLTIFGELFSINLTLSHVVLHFVLDMGGPVIYTVLQSKTQTREDDMKAIGYARVSSTEQVNGTSLDNQQAQIREYASLKLLDLMETLVDAGISGGKPLATRPQGQRLAEKVEVGEISSVIITKLDRAFRSASDCLSNVETWDKKGVNLHILNLGGQSLDTGTPIGKFFITIMAAAAELERNLINERCNEGRKARRAEGRRIGEVPFGYTLAEDGKTLLQNPQEQEALSLIRSMKAKGFTLRQIAGELNSRGYKAKKGGIWTFGQVQSILRRAA